LTEEKRYLLRDVSGRVTMVLCGNTFRDVVEKTVKRKMGDHMNSHNTGRTILFHYYTVGVFGKSALLDEN
jgi:hypothetical protein